jgi:2-(1,2-epoxy-1,2-dihydrophenyl)acetyl-CoA isomerase
MSSDQAVLCHREGSVGIITLNRPASYNVLSQDVAVGLQQAIRTCSDDEGVRALILTGNGNAFCGGGDIKFMVAAREAKRSVESFDELFRVLHGTIIAMREMPKPIIAALNGVAAGGGLGLALACDFRIASPKVNLLTAFLGIGASPDSSSSFFLPRYVGIGRATELFLRNKPVGAEEALALGLLNAVVPQDQVMAEAMKLANELAQGPTAAFGRTKLLLNQSFNTSLQNHLHSEAQLITISAQAPDFTEGTNAFLAKRKAAFTGK